MKKIMLIFGTRPEAIKMCPLIVELRKHNKFDVKVCVTGQHREMLDSVLNVFGIVPDFDFNIMQRNQTLSDITGSVLAKMELILKEQMPDIVLVHGDTTTAFSAALACFYQQVSVGHVEAGLRTYDICSPFPEEFNRQTIDIISEYCFAPTEMSRDNLMKSGKAVSKIYVTGNTGIDALKYTQREYYDNPLIKWAEGSRLILITAHRRENLGKPMKNMFNAIKRVLDEHEDVKAIYPIHRNPLVRNVANQVFGVGDSKIELIDPLDVIDFHNFMSRAYLILTDSGGVQEEAPYFGKPVLVMRNTTERPEGVVAGTLKLVGTDEETIYREFTNLLDNNEEYVKMSNAANPYGNGHASERIAEILCASL